MTPEMKLFESAWSEEYPDHPDGSAQFEKTGNDFYVRTEVRCGWHMFQAGMKLANQVALQHGRKRIEISEDAFNLLVRWASVGRTIDTSMQLIDTLDSEQADYTFDELKTLKPALDECGNAAKTQWWKENPDGLPVQPKQLR